MPEYASVPVEQLQTFPGNPRRGDVKSIAESLAKPYGQYRPIVVNRGTITGRPNEVLAGNHTLMAAQSLGWEAVECSIIDVGDEDARTIVAFDNRSADLGDYDKADLYDLLAPIADLTGTGYTRSDLDELLESLQPPDSADMLDPPAEDRYTPQFAVTVICRDEQHQQDVFEQLRGGGLDCKVVTV